LGAETFAMDNVESIDIIDDEKLVAEYGVRIPVLKNQKGQELAWPFELNELVTWVKNS